jgi:hypothetical protein
MIIITLIADGSSYSEYLKGDNVSTKYFRCVNWE